jgi:hypothetical protein
MRHGSLEPGHSLTKSPKCLLAARLSVAVSDAGDGVHDLTMRASSTRRRMASAKALTRVSQASVTTAQTGVVVLCFRFARVKHSVERLKRSASGIWRGRRRRGGERGKNANLRDGGRLSAEH